MTTTGQPHPTSVPAPAAPGLSRRTLLRLGGGAVVALGGGLAFAAPRGYLADLLARTLPGVTLDAEGVRLFERELFARRFDAPGEYAIAWGLRPAALVDPIAPGVVRRLREEFDRKALTFFLTGSDFFHLADPRAETVTYFGAPEMCAGNMFAVFDDDETADGEPLAAALPARPAWSAAALGVTVEPGSEGRTR